jgi:hypothetical protein
MRNNFLGEADNKREEQKNANFRLRPCLVHCIFAQTRVNILPCLNLHSMRLVGSFSDSSVYFVGSFMRSGLVSSVIY